MLQQTASTEAGTKLEERELETDSFRAERAESWVALLEVLGEKFTSFANVF